MPKKKLYSPEEIIRVHEALQEKFKEAGWGSVGRVEAALEVKRDYFSWHRRHRTLDHGALLSTLRALNVDPGEFFAELYGAGRGAVNLDDPESGANARRERSKPVAGYKDTKLAFVPKNAELAAKLDLWIEEMDELRYEDCESALLQLRQRASELPLDASAQWLSVAGSCLRVAGDIEDAGLCFKAALIVAPRETLVANILQRHSYVLRDQGDLRGALEMSERAAGKFCRLGEMPNFGTTLVDQGQFLKNLGRRLDAIHSVRRAMEFVSSSDRRNWCAIHQYLALWSQEAGGPTEIQESYEHARKALQLAGGRHLRGGLLGMQAAIMERLSRFREAAELHGEAVQHLRDQPLAALLATAHQVRAYSLNGSPERAAQAAQGAVAFIGPLRGNKVAQAVIVGLYRLRASDCIGVRIVDDLISKLSALCSKPASNDSVGGRLRRARLRANIGRRQAACELRMAEATLSKIEAGRTPGTTYERQIDAWIESLSPEVKLARSLLRRD